VRIAPTPLVFAAASYTELEFTNAALHAELQHTSGPNARTARAKARRRELRISVPIGYVWHREIGLGFDPDLQIREVWSG
jgi:hypothetical protein